MSNTPLPEVWLRGPLPGLSAYLQPVAHALLQAREEVNELLKDFPNTLFWEKPAGLASPGFHLQHLTGVLDRLFTYAYGHQLTEEQLRSLKAEGIPMQSETAKVSLLEAFHKQVDVSIEKLKNFEEKELTSARGVGRAQLPSTALGLFFHAAEHTMRHTGQLLVTVKVLKANFPNSSS